MARTFRTDTEGRPTIQGPPVPRAALRALRRGAQAVSIVLHEPVLDIDGRRCEVILNTPEDTRPEYRPDPDGAAIEEYCGLLPEEHADAETVTAVLDALRSAARDGIGCTPDAFAKMIAAAGLEDYA